MFDFVYEINTQHFLLFASAIHENWNFLRRLISLVFRLSSNNFLHDL